MSSNTTWYIMESIKCFIFLVKGKTAQKIGTCLKLHHRLTGFVALRITFLTADSYISMRYILKWQMAVSSTMSSNYAKKTNSPTLVSYIVSYDNFSAVQKMFKRYTIKYLYGKCLSEAWPSAVEIKSYLYEMSYNSMWT